MQSLSEQIVLKKDFSYEKYAFLFKMISSFNLQLYYKMPKSIHNIYNLLLNEYTREIKQSDALNILVAYQYLPYNFCRKLLKIIIGEYYMTNILTNQFSII